MKVTVVSHKRCWQDAQGRWLTNGGFPAQMEAIGSLFDALTLIVLQGEPQAGGAPLPAEAQVIALPDLAGTDRTRIKALLAHLPAYGSRIAGLIRSADVVHVPLPGDIPLLGFFAALSQRKHILARYCAAWESSSNTSLSRRLTKALLRSTAGGRRVVLATGLGDAPPAENIHWIFSTAVRQADLEHFWPALDRPPQQPLRVASAGRLIPEKGFSELIRAAGLLARNGIRLDVTIIGDGPQREALEALARQEQAPVRFSGQMAQAGVMRCLQEVDLGVFPTRTESLGKARVEALMCGTPLVTTATGFGGALTGKAGERGWLIPPGDPEALAQILSQVLSTPLDWPALRRRCRVFSEQFTLERWAMKIGKICAGQWGLTWMDGKLRP